MRTKQTARASRGGARHRFCHPIWEVAEIFELILCQLPTRELLLIQRVRSAWRDMIANSPRLQELLFFKPKPASVSKRDVIPRPRKINPLLVVHFQKWFRRGDRSDDDRFGRLPWAETVARLAFLRKDASWRNMLISQPPLTVFEHATSMTVYGGSGLEVGCLKVSDGVRMGMLYDRTQHALNNGYHHSMTFYTVVDGKLVDDEGWCDLQDNELEMSPVDEEYIEEKRSFGGDGKLTLVTDGHRSCRMGGFELGRQSPDLSSVGTVELVVDMEKVEHPRGGGYTWWNLDGRNRKQW